MCYTESVVHTSCRHWGKDRFVSEPCPRARKVKSGRTTTYTMSPWRNNSDLSIEELPNFTITPSMFTPDKPRTSSSRSSISRIPTWQRSQAHSQASSSISSNISDTSSISSVDRITCSATSPYPLPRRMSCASYSSNGDYMPSTPLETEQPPGEDEYVYLPCDDAESMGCANGDGLCPACATPTFTAPVYEAVRPSSSSRYSAEAIMCTAEKLWRMYMLEDLGRLGGC